MLAETDRARITAAITEAETERLPNAPFRIDVSDFANYGGKNVLALRVDATLGEGWFYEGAGIYRHVRLVETSPALAAMQHELLVDCGVAVSWAQTLKEVPDGPVIVIGNEFLDALPVRQFVRVNGQWRERTVRVNGEGSLAFDVADKPEPYIRANAANGEILEVSPSGHRVMFELGARLVKQGGAALLIDYGHAITRFGDTLQALRAHRYVDPLVAPGECDLTAHVDFAGLARVARATGASARAIALNSRPIRSGSTRRCAAVSSADARAGG